jgi:hypothetical protein
MVKRKSALYVMLAAAVLVLSSALGATAGSGGFTEFSGTSLCVEVLNSGSYVPRDGKLHMRGVFYTCTDTAASFPEFSGNEVIEVNAILDLSDNLSGPMWGTSHFTNDLGEWIGVWTGERTSQGFAYLRAHYRGMGGYEGMQAWIWLERLSPDPAAPYSFTGRILDPHK